MLIETGMFGENGGTAEENTKSAKKKVCLLRTRVYNNKYIKNKWYKKYVTNLLCHLVQKNYAVLATLTRTFSKNQKPGFAWC